MRWCMQSATRWSRSVSAPKRPTSCLPLRAARGKVGAEGMGAAGTGVQPRPWWAGSGCGRARGLGRGLVAPCGGTSCVCLWRAGEGASSRAHRVPLDRHLPQQQLSALCALCALATLDALAAAKRVVAAIATIAVAVAAVAATVRAPCAFHPARHDGRTGIERRQPPPQLPQPLERALTRRRRRMRLQ
eukprot:3151293-Prymnesium_polylepis.1